MILAEKIMKLRKQNGWSQEELAMKLNISRQSVSKWESGTSIPDLDKILKLSQIFGVSTDYLLKDEIEEEDMNGGPYEEEPVQMTEEVHTISISLEEANKYMDLAESSAKKIGAGVAACILSPVLLILLAGMEEFKVLSIPENATSGIGVSILLLIVAGAVAVFIMQGMKLDKFEYLERNILICSMALQELLRRREKNLNRLSRSVLPRGLLFASQV